MSLTFGKTRDNHFGRIFNQNPRLLTRNPYMNFLRFYKQQHPKYDLRRILRDGSKAWIKLDMEEKQKFTQKEVLRRHTDKVVQPRAKWRNKSRSNLIPGRRMPMSYKKRSLKATKNIRRRRRNIKRFSRYGTGK